MELKMTFIPVYSILLNYSRTGSQDQKLLPEASQISDHNQGLEDWHV